MTVSALGLLGVALQGEIVQYASVSTIGSMFYGIVWSVALIRLPAKLPDQYARAAFRLAPRSLWFIALANIAISLLFLYIGVRNNPGPSVAYALLVGMGAAYFFARQRRLAREGVSLHDVLRNEAKEAWS
jgi:hypothetical protein